MAYRQYEGPLGWGVDQMIRRSVKRAFHTVWWRPPAEPFQGPVIFVPNHQGWHDGYLMYIAATALQIRVLDWIQEYAAFPLFGKVGGMPFPLNDPATRAATVKRTIRLMRSESRSLILFAEGILHRPGPLLPFGRSLEVVAKAVPGVQIVPMAIRYELSQHERPEAWIRFGTPILAEPEGLSARARLAVQSELDTLAAEISTAQAPFSVLAQGTLDVNERWDVRKFRR